ncbi:hypothetical protein Plhal304r1_c036g0111151 [Plasmopara halstedii]
MRRPYFSFVLHLLYAVVLLVDVFAELSTSNQTLQSNERDASDRQLRAQDSQEQKEVIGDEERVAFRQALSPLSENLLELRLSTVPMKKISHPPKLSSREKVALWTRILGFKDKGIDYLQLKLELPRLKQASGYVNHLAEILRNNRQKGRIGLLALAEKVLLDRYGHKLRISLKTALSDPIVRAATFVASSLPKRQGDIGTLQDWIPCFMVFIKSGFTHDEVEIILKTARLDAGTVAKLLLLYDPVRYNMRLEDVMDTVTKSSTHSADLRTIIDVRAAEFIAYRAQKEAVKLSLDRGQDLETYPLHEWKILLEKWVERHYTQEQVSQILQTAKLHPEGVQSLLRVYAKSQELHFLP